MGLCLSRETSFARHEKLIEETLIKRKFTQDVSLEAAVECCNKQYSILALGDGNFLFVPEIGATKISDLSEITQLYALLRLHLGDVAHSVRQLVRMKTAVDGGAVFAAEVRTEDDEKQQQIGGLHWMRVALGSKQVSVMTDEDKSSFYGDYRISLQGNELIFFNVVIVGILSSQF